MQPSHRDGPLKARLAGSSIQVHLGDMFEPTEAWALLERQFGNRDITIALTITRLLTLKIPEEDSRRSLSQSCRRTQQRQVVPSAPGRPHVQRPEAQESPVSIDAARQLQEVQGSKP